METAARVASRADLDALTAVIATAFRDDPVWGEYSFPEAHARPDRPARFWRFYLEAMLRLRSTFMTPGDEAAAVWVPPGERELTDAQEHGISALLGELLGDRQGTGRARHLRPTRRCPSRP